MIVAFAIYLAAGALLGALVCKAIQFRLTVDVIAGLGACAGAWAADKFLSGDAWPLIGIPAGWAAVVVIFRLFHVKEYRP